jgi:hypothetical protein
MCLPYAYIMGATQLRHFKLSYTGKLRELGPRKL